MNLDTRCKRFISTVTEEFFVAATTLPSGCCCRHFRVILLVGSEDSYFGVTFLVSGLGS